MKSFEEYKKEENNFTGEGKDCEGKDCNKTKKIEEEMKHRQGVWAPERTSPDNFDDELDLIDDEDLKDFVTEYLDKKVPEYFWKEAGAKKAGHHPAQDYGEGGLVRHSRMCMRIAEDLLRNDLFAEVADRKNELFAALICHDTKKNGNDNSRYTFDHPTHAANSMKKFFRDEYEGKKTQKLQEQVDFMARCISSHMGQWNSGFGKDKNVKLPLPNDPYCAFVHLCDYIASRMFIGNLDYTKKK